MDQNKLEFYITMAAQELKILQGNIEKRTAWMSRKLTQAQYSGEFTAIATLATEVAAMLQRKEEIETKFKLLQSFREEK